MLFKKISIVFLLITVIYGCSTKKNTFLSRNYQNMTAHFNVFFNGNESFKAGAKKVESANKDNYTQLLAIFPSSKKENLDVASGEMDIAIQKGGKLITLHSITAKPQSSNYARKHKNQKEFNNWVDDAYLLVAKSLYYKKGYDECITTCNTIIRDYPETPSRYDAVIWLGRALIEKKEYSDAQTILDGYDISTGAPRKLLSFYMATVADLNIRQEKYTDAIPYLKVALEETKKKSVRIRYQYILAQLYHMTGNAKEAAQAYEKVIDMNPSYEIAFNAKVNRGSILLAGANSTEIKKQLYKLLKSSKNIDFRGRIYYALGKVNLSEKDEASALVNFRKSIDTSKDNPTQKAVTYIEIGNLLYAREIYKSAYLNYDSATTILDKESKEYAAIDQRHSSLKNLVEQMDIAQYEDSIQRIAKMSTTDQSSFVTRMIALKQKAVADKEAARQAAMQNGAGSSEFDTPYSPDGTNTPAGGSGKWYFYNPAITTQGKSEFERRWGSRKLEDNWRRANKESAMSDPSTENFPTDPDAGAASKLTDKKSVKTDSVSTRKHEVRSASDEKILTKEEYLKDIPNTPAQLAASNESLETALYQMSRVYSNQLHDYPNAEKTLKELLDRFPNSKFTAEYLMTLYQAYKDGNDEAGANKTKEQLIREYPDNDFTQYLSDPEYFTKYELRKRANDSIYQSSYESYLNNDFDACLSNVQKTLSTYPKNELADKFTLLRALSNAKTGNTDLFKSDLTTIVTTYPSSECTPLAQALLAEIEKGKTPIKVANLTPKTTFGATAMSKDTTVAAESLYQFPDSSAMYVVILANGICDKNRLNYNVADYNFSRFIVSDFELTPQTLKDKYMLKIEPFPNATEAMDYFFAIREHTELFEVNNVGAVKILVISKANLAKLTASGELDGYIKFFNRNYLQRND